MPRRIRLPKSMSCDTRDTDKLDMKGKRVYNNKQYLSPLCASLIETSQRHTYLQYTIDEALS